MRFKILQYLVPQALCVLATSVAQAQTATTTTFQGPRLLSDQNSQGTLLGDTAADLVALYGGTPVAQPTSLGAQLASQIALSTSNGVIVKYQVQPVVNAQNATTTTNQTTSVSSTLQAGMTYATNSVYAVNKPTHQAGIGIVGVLSASTQTLAINYTNISTGALTPTASETYDVIELKAGSPLVTSASLSPAAVNINTTVEQIFTLATTAGQPNVCLPGTIALVNKPTAQSGLAYSPFARVVGVNQVGITFGYVGSATTAASSTITPTAAETWTMAFLPQLNAFNPTYIYGIPSGATATGNSTTLEQTSQVIGIYANDVITGISRATTQAGVFIGSYRVTSGLPATTSGVIGINYGSVVTSSTPTTSEVLLCTIQRQVPLNPLMLYNALLTATTCPATTSVEVTTTVQGLVVSTSVLINKPTCTPGIIVGNARVSAANTLAVEYMNLTTTSINVPAETYLVGNVQLQGPGTGLMATSGLFVAQSYFPAAQQSMQLAQALRAALVALNAIAGT